MSVLAQAGPVGVYGRAYDRRLARDAGFSHHLKKAIAYEELEKTAGPDLVS